MVAEISSQSISTTYVETEQDSSSLAEQLVNTLTVKEITDSFYQNHSQVQVPIPFDSQLKVFEGSSYDYVGQRVFGGQVLAQALMSASHTVEDGTGKLKPCHSLHGYFLRGGDIDHSVLYQVQTLRDGRSLSARRVTAFQYKPNEAGEPVEQVIFSMIASFAPMEEGLDYQPDMPIYPPPEDLLTEQELKEQYLSQVPDALKARFMRKRHIEIKPVQPRDPISPEPMKPKQANWIRIPEIQQTLRQKIGQHSIAMQQALLAFASDFYLVGTGLMSHGVSFMTKGLQAASIDHSLHFHRPFDLNDWMLYDMWSDNTAYAKGLNHGQFWQDGKLIATVQQEGLMRLRVKS